MAATRKRAALPNGRRPQQKVADCLGCAHKRAQRGVRGVLAPPRLKKAGAEPRGEMRFLAEQEKDKRNLDMNAANQWQLATPSRAPHY
jgi:hypothetical protein